MVTSPRIVAELNRIADRHEGLLRPEDVVEAAASPRSPLHSWFGDWDDAEDAHKWRLYMARQLIRVTVSYIAGPENPVSRVFVSLTPDRVDSGYRATAVVLSNAQYREQLLSDALAEMECFARKYQALTELAELFDVWRKVGKKLRAKRAKFV